MIGQECSTGAVCSERLPREIAQWESLGRLGCTERHITQHVT